MDTLEALNEIMLSTGKRPVSTVPVDADLSSDAAVALMVMAEVDLKVQSRGWAFNTELHVTLEPNLYSLAGGSWSNADRRLTVPGGFANAAAGNVLRLGGAGVIAGEHTIRQVIDVNIVEMEASISQGGVDVVGGISGSCVANRIATPKGTITIDSTGVDAWRNIVQRGKLLYDRDNATSQFRGSVTVTYKAALDFDCVPYEIQKLITTSTAVLLNERFPGASGGLYRRPMLIAAKEEAFRAAGVMDGDIEDVNFFNSKSNQDVLGNRRRGGSAYTGDWA